MPKVIFFWFFFPIGPILRWSFLIYSIHSIVSDFRLSRPTVLGCAKIRGIFLDARWDIPLYRSHARGFQQFQGILQNP